MIIDEVTLYISAGKGGDGKVSFHRAKFVPKGGPDGGNGGKGGAIYIQGVSDLTALRQFQGVREIKAEDGQGGMDSRKSGRDAKDLILKIPVGTTITNTTTGEKIEILSTDQKFLFLNGGRGGRGNNEFKNSIRQAPDTAERGKKGSYGTFLFNLAFIADIGLIGLPNAGKSSLLNVLTAAHARVANYPFTTLEPNLGIMNHAIIADIPGLIEGAHTGKGLGLRFLKHITKTKILVHCIDSTTESVTDAYHQVRDELEKYDVSLLEKKEIVLLTKIDEIDERDVKKKVKELQKISNKVLPVSILDDECIKLLKVTLGKELHASK